jgi:acetamidase/formamidase
MAMFGDCRVAEVVNQVKGLYCMLPKRPRAQPGIRPVGETRRHYVSHAVDADLMEALNASAMHMIREVSDRRQLRPIDAYSLASLAMDARVGRLEPGARNVHCLLPKSLWVAEASRKAGVSKAG